MIMESQKDNCIRLLLEIAPKIMEESGITTGRAV